MKLFRSSRFFLLILLVLCHALNIRAAALQISPPSSPNIRTEKFTLGISFDSQFANCYYSQIGQNENLPVVKRPVNSGIKEIVSNKFLGKYQKWKNELLTTDFGRRQWENYSSNKNFVLIITVSEANGQGAGTEKYLWDETGRLVGATIVLGNKIDTGFPTPAYFPVMNSLSLNIPSYKISGDILAAAKIAHEFGHINLTAVTSSELFKRQNRLIPIYNSILLDNGYNTRDQRLVDLADQMGGTPVKIWENREYWGEANAMLFLLDRINKENFYCLVYSKMRNNIDVYAKDYKERFNRIDEIPSTPVSCRR